MELKHEIAEFEKLATKSTNRTKVELKREIDSLTEVITADATNRTKVELKHANTAYSWGNHANLPIVPKWN